MAIDKPSVLVTGAGGGLGRAITDYFHDKGYHVALSQIIWNTNYHYSPGTTTL